MWSFIEISGMVYNLQKGQKYIAEMAIFNIYFVQRVTTPTVG